jgi:hypothetical protein
LGVKQTQDAGAKGKSNFSWISNVIEHVKREREREREKKYNKLMLTDKEPELYI